MKIPFNLLAPSLVTIRSPAPLVTAGEEPGLHHAVRCSCLGKVWHTGIIAISTYHLNTISMRCIHVVWICHSLYTETHVNPCIVHFLYMTMPYFEFSHRLLNMRLYLALSSYTKSNYQEEK